MSKNIVICCDGTGNQIGDTISNVLKLFRVLRKNDHQRVYYNPGVGTIGQKNPWQRVVQKARGVFGLATGYGLDDDVLGAYRFLSEVYAEGDKVWLFGFSRGAYTVRVLAAFLHVIGLLRPDQLNLAGYALSAFKKSSSDSQRSRQKDRQATLTPSTQWDRDLESAWHFSRVAGGRPISIEFVGVWDTVASVITPRSDKLLLDLQSIRYTRTNPSVKIFRHAISLDERRRMFRLNAWKEGQMYRPNPFVAASEIPQDIVQVWFSGVHADVGGGYPEAESGLSKYSLLWMIEEAKSKGLQINAGMVGHLVRGEKRGGTFHKYTKPDVIAPVHNSMTAAWLPLEWVPKNVKWREWTKRHALAGWYLPRSEPRIVPEGAFIHWTVFARKNRVADYRPINLPANYRVVGSPDERAGVEGLTPIAGEPGADTFGCKSS